MRVWEEEHGVRVGEIDEELGDLAEEDEEVEKDGGEFPAYRVTNLPQTVISALDEDLKRRILDGVGQLLYIPRFNCTTTNNTIVDTAMELDNVSEFSRTWRNGRGNCCGKCQDRKKGCTGKRSLCDRCVENEWPCLWALGEDHVLLVGVAFGLPLRRPSSHSSSTPRPSQQPSQPPSQPSQTPSQVT